MESKTLLNIAKDCMMNAQNNIDFELEDYAVFSEITEQLQDIEKRQLKPYLVIWNINHWEYQEEYITSALLHFGYEYVGNMDNADGQYIFNNNDIFQDRLWRFKDKNCDYTTILRLNNN